MGQSAAELQTLKIEQAREIPKSDGQNDKIPKELVNPGFTHMAIATLVRRGLAHYVVTTNLDGPPEGIHDRVQDCDREDQASSSEDLIRSDRGERTSSLAWRCTRRRERPSRCGER